MQAGVRVVGCKHEAIARIISANVPPQLWLLTTTRTTTTTTTTVYGLAHPLPLLHACVCAGVRACMHFLPFAPACVRVGRWAAWTTA
jgi:hypothetical protein